MTGIDQRSPIVLLLRQHLQEALAMSKRERKLAERIRRIQSDPCNEEISRADHAGEIVEGHLVMHNGLRVKPMDECYMRLLQANGGCHEPQEEMVFQEVLQHIDPGACIIELGAYWAFYSLWFASEVADARCYLVEPEREHMEVGMYNFDLNGVTGHFTESKVGHGYWGMDQFLVEQQIDSVDVLHADIQGREYEMLLDADDALRGGRIGYIFLGTHSQDLHYTCMHHLRERDYVIIADADFTHGTYCEDGVLVARHRSIHGVEPIDLPRREPHQPYTPRSLRPTLGRMAIDRLASLFPLRRSA